MQTGTIQSVILPGNFGFIRSPESERDLFFFADDLVELKFDVNLTGLSVCYEIQAIGERQRAVKVRGAE